MPDVARSCCGGGRPGRGGICAVAKRASRSSLVFSGKKEPLGFLALPCFPAPHPGPPHGGEGEEWLGRAFAGRLRGGVAWVWLSWCRDRVHLDRRVYAVSEIAREIFRHDLRQPRSPGFHGVQGVAPSRRGPARSGWNLRCREAGFQVSVRRGPPCRVSGAL